MRTSRAFTTVRKTLRERFYAKTQRDPDTGCLLWTASVASGGYGQLNIGGRHLRVNRIAWEMERGQIPHGMRVLHHCDVPRCVNVDHLFLGTNADNSADMVAKGRSPHIRGSHNGQSKLTEAQVQEIRVATGLQREIAARFGVSRSLVSLIKSGKGWKHVGMLADGATAEPA